MWVGVMCSFFQGSPYALNVLFQFLFRSYLLFMNFFMRIKIHIDPSVFIKNIYWICKKLFLIRMMKCRIFTQRLTSDLITLTASLFF